MLEEHKKQLPGLQYDIFYSRVNYRTDGQTSKANHQSHGISYPTRMASLITKKGGVLDLPSLIFQLPLMNDIMPHTYHGL